MADVGLTAHKYAFQMRQTGSIVPPCWPHISGKYCWSP